MVTMFCRRSWGREKVGSNLLLAVKTKAAFRRKKQELGTLASYLCVVFPLRIMRAGKVFDNPFQLEVRM